MPHDHFNLQGGAGPHAGLAVFTAGLPLSQAAAALILIHGRGASAQDILSLYDQLALPQLVAFAPQAHSHTWYPHSFLAPIPDNQPWLDSALQHLDLLTSKLLADGISGDRIALLGFSQGACLASEFAARHPRHYGALIAFTGGLIGPPGTLREYPGSLAGTPVFLGSGDPDPHVPFKRVEETQRVLQQMGATVDLRRYPGMPHTINQDELNAARTLLAQLVSRKRDPA